MSNVQRVFYVGVSPTPIDPQTGLSAHWVKFTGASGVAPEFPVDGQMVGVGTVQITGMYGVTGRLFEEGETFESTGYARVLAPVETALPEAGINIFDTTVSTAISYRDAVINTTVADYYYEFDETSGVDAAASITGTSDLEYGVNANTSGYDTPSSLNSGFGSGKDIAGVSGREIYDPTLAGIPADWVVNLHEYQFGYTYSSESALGSGVTDDGYVPYTPNQATFNYTGSGYTAPNWAAAGRVHGGGSDTRADQTNVISRIIRHTGNGGKYVFKFIATDINATSNIAGFTVARSGSLFGSQGNFNTANGLAVKPSGNAYFFGTYAPGPTASVPSFTSGDEVYVFLDLDADNMYLSVNGLTTSTATDISSLTNFISVAGQRAGDNNDRIEMDFNPDISGVVSLPASTVEADWTGWNDWEQWQTEYEVDAIPNTASLWSTESFGGGNSVQDIGDHIRFQGRLVSPDITASGSGASNFCWVIEMTHDEQIVGADTARPLQGFMRVNDVDGTIEQTTNEGFGDATDSPNVMGLAFSATAGDKLNLCLEYDVPADWVSVGNMYIVRRR